MATIGVDVDSNLYDFETPSRNACLKLWEETGNDKFKEAAYHPWTEWRSPADVLGVPDWLKAIAVVHEDDAILGMEPFPDAVATCQALVRAGHDLIYITNRAAHTEEATRQWLINHNFLGIEDAGTYDWGTTSLVVTEGDKRPFLREAQYLIDDRLKTCVQFVYDFDWQHRDLLEESMPRERIAFVKAYPYNQNATDIPGLIVAPTWAAIRHYLVKKNLLAEKVAA